MAEEGKPIDHRGGTTCMDCFVFLLFADTHASWKILEVAKGVEYIHSEGVVHGDLRGVLYPKRNMLRN